MTTTIQIEDNHGYLLDADGKVVIRFGNWRIGEHHVNSAVESVEHVGGPNAHTKSVHEDYRPGPL